MSLKENKIFIPKFLDHYDYLEDLIDCCLNNKRWDITQLLLVGSRGSAKNYSLTDLFVKLAIMDINAIVYCLRWNSEDANNWFKEIIEHVKKFEIDCAINMTFREIKINRFTFKFEYLHKPTEKKRGTKGKRGGKGTFHNYIFVWTDEAYEVDMESLWGTIPTYRASTNSLIQKILLFSSNPDNRENEYIRMCTEIAEPTRDIMELHGQLKIVDQDKRMVHWTRWTLNPYMNEDDIQIIRNCPPNKRDPWDLGLPGSLKGAIFTEYIDRIKKPLDFSTTRFDIYTAGVDWAWGNKDESGYTICKLNAIQIKPFLMKSGICEYAHQNKKDGFKSGQQKINDICQMLINKLKIFRALNPKAIIHVFVDYAHEGTELINSFQKTMGNMGYDINDICFKKCLKLGDEVEVEELQNMIWNGYVYDDIRTSPRFFKELQNAFWDETTKSTIAGGWDHAIDADAYSMNNFRYLFKNKPINKTNDIEGELWGSNTIYS